MLDLLTGVLSWLIVFLDQNISFWSGDVLIKRTESAFPGGVVLNYGVKSISWIGIVIINSYLDFKY